jgi:hypothetical protein
VGTGRPPPLSYTRYMHRALVTSSLGLAVRRVPGLKRIPVLKLLALAEVLLLARDHVMWLTPGERRRFLELVRLGRGRRRNLSEAERLELASLIAKIEPRLFAGETVEKLSPFPLPRRLLYGPRRRR